jgi:hypothetical protein
MQLVDRGWVNHAELQTLWPRVQRAGRWDNTVLSLWQILGAEAAARGLSSPERPCP